MSKGLMKTRNIKQTFKDLVVPKKIKCFIMARVGNTLKIVGVAKGKPTSKTFTKGNLSYLIDTTRAVFDRDNTPILFYLLNRSTPLTFFKRPAIKPDGQEIMIEPSILSAVLKTKKMRETLGAQGESMYLMMILALSIGIVALVGYLTYTQNNLMTEIIRLRNLLGGVVF